MVLRNHQNGNAMGDGAAGTNAGLDRREEDGRTGRLQLFGYGSDHAVLTQQYGGDLQAQRRHRLVQIQTDPQVAAPAASQVLEQINIWFDVNKT